MVYVKGGIWIRDLQEVATALLPRRTNPTFVLVSFVAARQ